MTQGNPGSSMQPYHVLATSTAVEAWTGYRIQPAKEERHDWQRVVKAELKVALARIATHGTTLAGFYDTTNPAVTDVENSLVTNMLDTLPGDVTVLRFERGIYAPPEPPDPIELVGGHLHYYRYAMGGEWTTWEPDEVLASWDRVPRRLPGGAGHAGPAWLALREGHANRTVDVPGVELRADAVYGLRLVEHVDRRDKRTAISLSENAVDGVLAAFHGDRFSDALFPALTRRFPRVTAEELRRALDLPVGPLFPTPAIRSHGKSVQFSPADERCILGKVAIREDCQGPLAELSGELFTVRRR
jgi:hypothetical protein